MVRTLLPCVLMEREAYIRQVCVPLSSFLRCFPQHSFQCCVEPLIVANWRGSTDILTSAPKLHDFTVLPHRLCTDLEANFMQLLGKAISCTVYLASAPGPLFILGFALKTQIIKRGPGGTRLQFICMVTGLLGSKYITNCRFCACMNGMKIMESSI